MSDILKEICARKREHIRGMKAMKPEGVLLEEASQADSAGGFIAALQNKHAAGEVALICEVKKASPSGGVLREDFDPVRIAKIYEREGAACISVLTDGPYFRGSDNDLIYVSQAVPLPILRKDFMLDPYQVIESRVIGADCILLIMAALEIEQARELETVAHELGMDVLAEVHDEVELEQALQLRTGLIGINNRDLKTLQTDLGTTERLASLVPKQKVIVSESGIKTRADIDRIIRAGVETFLIGESLLKSPDIGAALRALL